MQEHRYPIIGAKGCHLLVLGGILTIFRFQGYFCNFIGFKGYFSHFLGFRDIWSFFIFRGYFGNFLGFGSILLLFQVLGIFWSFFRFRGYFDHFLGFGGISVIFFYVSGVFQSFFRFREYFSHFLSLGDILVIFEVSWIFWFFQWFWVFQSQMIYKNDIWVIIRYLVKTQLTLMLIGFNWVNTCGGQLILYVQIALERARLNIQSHMYRLHQKGLGPIPSPRIREYLRTTSKGRDENYTLKRGKEQLCRI